MNDQASHSKPANLIQTIERVSAILDLVAQMPQGISIRDLSSGLKLPKGTVHRILTSLQYFGYIRQDKESKDYCLGLKLMELGALLSSQLDLRKLAAPILKELADRAGEAVHMVIMDRNEIVYIDKVEAPVEGGGLKMASRVGARNPAHSCAVGKALMAYWTDEDLDLLIAEKGLPQRTASTITDPRLFKEHLKTVRHQGFAVDDEENERGIRCVAAPIFDGKGEALAALSVSGPAFRVTKKLIQEFLKKEVIRAAAEVSKRLGFVKERG